MKYEELQELIRLENPNPIPLSNYEKGDYVKVLVQDTQYTAEWRTGRVVKKNVVKTDPNNVCLIIKHAKYCYEGGSYVMKPNLTPYIVSSFVKPYERS